MFIPYTWDGYPPRKIRNRFYFIFTLSIYKHTYSFTHPSTMLPVITRKLFLLLLKTNPSTSVLGEPVDLGNTACNVESPFEVIVKTRLGNQQACCMTFSQRAVLFRYRCRKHGYKVHLWLGFAR